MKDPQKMKEQTKKMKKKRNFKMILKCITPQIEFVLYAMNDANGKSLEKNNVKSSLLVENV